MSEVRILSEQEVADLKQSATDRMRRRTVSGMRLLVDSYLQGKTPEEQKANINKAFQKINSGANVETPNE